MAILGAGAGRLISDDLVRGARGCIRNRTEEPHVRACGTNMGHPSKSESKTAANLRLPAGASNETRDKSRRNRPVNREKMAGKVTLTELIIFPFYLLLVVGSANWGYHRYGGWGGAIRGLVVVQVILFLFGCAFGLCSMIYAGMPSYPACRTGKCRWNNYQRRRLDDGQVVLFCGCGTPYRKRGHRFLEVQPDGSLRPYMVWRAFRGWFPDG
jgi:hypothetical protein